MGSTPRPGYAARIPQQQAVWASRATRQDPRSLARRRLAQVDDSAATRSGAADLTAQAQAIDATGAALYRALAASGANTAFSPTSIAVALQMALLGARGETAAELARFLHVTGPDMAAEACVCSRPRLDRRRPEPGRYVPHAEHDVGAIWAAPGA